MAGWQFFLNNVEVEEPIGWDSVEFTATRMDNHGIDQPFSSAMTFYQLGAKILKSAWDSNFTSASVDFKITSTEIVNGLPYEFIGTVDFSTYEEVNSCDSDSWQVTVSILQDTFRDKFKARYDVEVDLFTDKDLDGNTIGSGFLDTDVIRLHGQSLNLIGNGGSLASTSYTLRKFQTPAFPSYWTNEYASVIVPVYWDTSDFTGIFGSTKDVVGLAYTDTNAIFQDNSGSGQTRQFILSWQTFRVDFNFTIFAWNTGFPPLPATMNIALRYRILDSSGTFVSSSVLENSQVINQSPVGGGPTTWNVPAGSTVINLLPDHRIILQIRWGILGNVQYGSDPYDAQAQCELNLFDDIKIKLTETNDAKASICNCMTVEKFLRRIIYQITGSSNKLLSDCFSESSGGKYANNVITNGLLLRRYEPDNTPYVQLSTSFKKAFESLSAIFGLGWAFERQLDGTYKIRVEPYDYFYDNTIELTLNDVAELRQTTATDKLYSQLKLGYQDNWKNMALGGIDAICTDRNYFIDNKAIKYGETSTLEIKSEIIGEGIAIEYSRRLQFFDDNSGSSDRPNDYALFLIWTIRENIELSSEGAYPYYYFPDETGTITLTAYRASWASSLINFASIRWGDSLFRYNLFHTSARVALRHWPILGGNTFGMINPVWRFQVGEYQTRFDSAIPALSQPGVIEDTSDTGNSPLLAEDGNISEAMIRNDFKQYITKPIIFEVEYPQTFCDFIDLANYNPYKKVRVTIGDVVVSGYILTINNKPEDATSGGTTKFTLIASAVPDGLGKPFDDGFDDGYEAGG